MYIRSQDRRILTDKIDLRVVCDGICNIDKYVKVGVKPKDYMIVTESESIIIGKFKRESDAISVLDDIQNHCEAGTLIYEIPVDEITEKQREANKLRQRKFREKRKLDIMEGFDYE